MMVKRYGLLAVCAVCMACLVSCETGNSGFQQTDEGLCYRFYEVHPDGAMPSFMDYLKLRMDYYLNDSLIYRSAEKDECPRIQFKTPSFGGDIFTGLGMMHEGDSAAFIVRADSTLHYLFHRDLSDVVVQPEDRMRFEIKLLQIQSPEAFQREIDSLLECRKKTEEALAMLKSQSERELSDFLKSNGIAEEARENRVFVIPLREGQGPRAAVGSKALITYEAYLLDGTYLGSSNTLGMSPYEVPVGQGKVLKGLDEGIAHMSKGEKARIVVPYALAYGADGYGSIPPYANLLFVVELLDLVSDQ